MMERLTDTINGVVVYVGPGNEFKNGLIPAELSPDQVRTAMRRLGAYEDTGLTPERCSELAAAAKNGRLIDADETAKKLRGECVAKFPGSFALGLYAAAAALEQMPTVDAAEEKAHHDAEL